MLYKITGIIFGACCGIVAMDVSTKPVVIAHRQHRYRSVDPSSGVPLLQVLAAQKVYELIRQGKLSPDVLSPVDSQSSSPEELICHDILQQNFSQMRKKDVELYAHDLSSGRIPRDSFQGRVKQKILALEMKVASYR